MTAPPTNAIAGLRLRESLTAQDCNEMFALLSRHFEGVERDQFDQDLAAKNWIIEIRRDAGQLIGFSTLLVCEARFDGAPLTVIYSGDTIVSPEAWGSPILARTWIAAVNSLRAATPSRPCYWLLLTSGFRTYRFLPVFWREFFPRYNASTPSDQQRLLHHLACSHYHSCYDATYGIVRFPHPQKLRGSLGKLSSGRLTNPHVAFFLARNPGHAEGDELVCLTEISGANLTLAGRRMVVGSAE